jgi:hypothetical protein
VVFNSCNYQNSSPFWTYVIETSARLQTIICNNLQMISDLIDKLRCNFATIAFMFLYCAVIYVPMNNFIQVFSSFGTCFSVCQSKRIIMYEQSSVTTLYQHFNATLLNVDYVYSYVGITTWLFLLTILYSSNPALSESMSRKLIVKETLS